MNTESMTRDDLIATLGATRAKLQAAQERIADLEARVEYLVKGALVRTTTGPGGRVNEELRDR